ncbi:Wzz/FepE/Etk N-terminal domain-containing protein [Bacillus sonorensis]|nr:Wzz/FepE/Etk N-terminal domain-containing protein [Bacillus sonorensis]
MTAAASTAAVNYFLLTPVYQASVQILINGRQTSNFTDIQTNLELINTYNVIMKSPVILNKVKDDLNLQETTEELKKKLPLPAKMSRRLSVFPRRTRIIQKPPQSQIQSPPFFRETSKTL